MMVKGHTEVLAMLAMLDDQAIPGAKNAALKKQLTETRAHVAGHLEQAKKLQGRG